jgi:hypothetical protein
MIWEKADFKKMKIDTFSWDRERNILKECDWLAKIFHQFIDDQDLNALKGVTLNIIVRVITTTYDPNSPLVLRISDIKQRRIEAFKIFDTKTYTNGRFSEDVEDIILGKNPKVNRMILQFLKALDNMGYAAMNYYTESYYDLLGQLQSQEGKDLAQILILIEKIEAQAKKKAKEFFMGDEKLIDYIASENIYEQAENLTPEMMSRKLKAMKETITD